MDKRTENIIEDALQEQLHNAYLRGMAVGGKTFVGTIYDIIMKSKKQRSNPAKTLMNIEATCKRMLNVPNEYVKETTMNAVKEEVERVKANTDGEIKNG